ncbi:hypothetical protein BDV97DRAFT_345170 [Delphinella strobiligena]|nr:hypothetical protein BDV97DRAFT_345170 [Delphinella strobiligena]
MYKKQTLPLCFLLGFSNGTAPGKEITEEKHMAGGSYIRLETCRSGIASIYTLDTHIYQIDGNIQLTAITIIFVIAALPLPLTLASTRGSSKILWYRKLECKGGSPYHHHPLRPCSRWSRLRYYLDSTTSSE